VQPFYVALIVHGSGVVFAAGVLWAKVHGISRRVDQVETELRALRSVLYQVLGARVRGASDGT
jgi:hypothetical protein